ncbi:MAG: Nitroreductase family protein [Paenibacillus sp.]|jgi:nitroreductase|nr:Nitroreductase family protein [Paenibacillus sp.]
MSNTLNPEVVITRQAEFEPAPLFLNRWSPRSFQNKEVPADVLASILEAARWAPSASNNQPWRFIVARTPEDRERFLTFISPFNTEWCASAPVLAVAFAHQVSPNGSANRWGSFDTGAAWGYLALEAIRHGVYTHAMGGFDKDLAKETLGVPDDFEAMAVIALGFRGEKEQLSEKHQEREIPSSRRPFKESFFEGKFGDNLNF